MEPIPDAPSDLPVRVARGTPPNVDPRGLVGVLHESAARRRYLVEAWYGTDVFAAVSLTEREALMAAEEAAEQEVREIDDALLHGRRRPRVNDDARVLRILNNRWSGLLDSRRKHRATAKHRIDQSPRGLLIAAKADVGHMVAHANLQRVRREWRQLVRGGHYFEPSGDAERDDLIDVEDPNMGGVFLAVPVLRRRALAYPVVWRLLRDARLVERWTPQGIEPLWGPDVRDDEPPAALRKFVTRHFPELVDRPAS